MLNTILLQAAPAPGGGLGGILMIVLIFVIFYFFMIMPQQKRQKQQQKKLDIFRDGLKNGDKVVTAGGIHGRVREVKDTTIILEVADGVRIKVDKTSIYESMEDVAGANAANK